MNNIVSQLQNLKLKELKNLKKEIDLLIFEKGNEEIKDKVYKKGYYCSVKNRGEISGLTYLALPLYLDIYTYNREDHSDCHVSGLKEKQEFWVKYLDFAYEPTDNDDPMTGTAIMKVYMYYRKDCCPSESFLGISEEGKSYNSKLKRMKYGLTENTFVEFLNGKNATFWFWNGF